MTWRKEKGRKSNNEKENNKKRKEGKKKIGRGRQRSVNNNIMAKKIIKEK